MGTRSGQLETAYSARGIPTYRLEIWHDELRKHRLIQGADPWVVQRKAELQTMEWEARWSQICLRQVARDTVENKKRAAAERTAVAQHELQRLTRLLHHALETNDAFDWTSLKETSPFLNPKPSTPLPPPQPQLQSALREPQLCDAKYQPQLGLLDKLIPSRKRFIMKVCRERFDADHREWQQWVELLTAQNAAAEQAYRAELEAARQQHGTAIQEWEAQRTAFREMQRLHNEAIDQQREAYLAGSPEMLQEYCDFVLSNSDYPEYFPQECELDYAPETKTLIVEYVLPTPASLPTVKEVRYIQSRDEVVEQHLPQAQITKLYDDVIYQITLRTLYELFEADIINAIDAIVFNGWVTSIDRSTGQEVTACILSLQVQREVFMALNLANVDPKACFKALKGVGSSRLHSLTAVAPVLQIRREDRRFVSAYEVAHTLDASSNLAAMDWEDFEHLIRELFEKEFLAGGGEVKVTQASRDGGVDAVVFDPDPIRGGKIVIQAKRYTNTVGVSAVRDLYGTMMNEGANKGILVTTSDYGPDAYEFAKGKPLTLLSGANLLHMLAKHGYKARIDLQEARRLTLGR